MTGQLPGEAVTAAVEAILNAPYPKVGEGTARNFAEAALEAAAPALRAQGAAAERDRIRREAQDHRDDCDQSEHRCCLDTALDDLLDGDDT